MKDPNFVITEDTEDRLVIRDTGPWDTYPTVTNAVERVVEILAPVLSGRRLEYYDSEGVLDQIIVRDGKFGGFAPQGVVQ